MLTELQCDHIIPAHQLLDLPRRRPVEYSVRGTLWSLYSLMCQGLGRSKNRVILGQELPQLQPRQLLGASVHKDSHRPGDLMYG